MANMTKFSPDNGMTIYDLADAASRLAVSDIQNLIPSSASTSNNLATQNDIPSAGTVTDDQWVAITALLG